MKNKKQEKNIYKIIMIIFLIVVSIYGYYEKNNALETRNSNTTIINDGIQTEAKPNEFSLDNPNLQIFFFDVGQADSSLIIDNGVVMMIDAGKDDDGILLANYLKELGITSIDYLIGTHNHEDHIGGLDKIIKNLDVKNVYMPYESKITGQYKEIIDALNEKNQPIQTVEIGQIFEIGNAKGIVKFVDNNEPSNLNNSSIIMQIILRRPRLFIYG